MTADKPTHADAEAAVSGVPGRAGVGPRDARRRIAEPITNGLGRRQCMPVLTRHDRRRLRQPGRDSSDGPSPANSYKNYMPVADERLRLQQECDAAFRQGSIARYSASNGRMRSDQHLHVLSDCKRLQSIRTYLRLSLHGIIHGRWLRSTSTVVRAATARSAVNDDDLCRCSCRFRCRDRCRAAEDRRLPDVAGRADRRGGPEAGGAAAHKKGLMQQLFPREGETRPRLRFPEFRDAAEWEADKLGRLRRKSIRRNVQQSTSETGRYPISAHAVT